MQPIINGQKMSNWEVISVIINHNNVNKEQKSQVEHHVAMDTVFV